MIDEKKLMKEILYLKSVIRHNSAIDEIIKLIKQQEVVCEWIPMNDISRNPKEGKSYLVTYKTRTGQRHIQKAKCTYSGESPRCVIFGKIAQGRVIAWQPLPEPYKEDEKNEQ